MSNNYFKTPDNKLVFQQVASIIVEAEGYRTKNIDVVITIQEVMKNDQNCFKASIIHTSLIKGIPFSKAWLDDLKANNYGTDLTEPNTGRVIYGQNQVELLEAVLNGRLHH